MLRTSLVFCARQRFQACPCPPLFLKSKRSESAKVSSAASTFITDHCHISRRPGQTATRRVFTFGCNKRHISFFFVSFTGICLRLTDKEKEKKKKRQWRLARKELTSGTQLAGSSHQTCSRNHRERSVATGLLRVWFARLCAQYMV